jgi:hypothetical protein
MADVTLAVEAIVRSGIDPTDTGSLLTANTYQVQNEGRTFLHFKKSGAGACTVTVVTTAVVDGKAVADQTVTVPASTGDVMCGPWPPEIYNVKGDNYLEFTLSEITGLTVAALRLK